LLINRYLNREILTPLVNICAILVVIFAGYSATRFLPDAANGLLTGETVVALVFFKVLIALEVLIPVTLFFSIIMVLARMHADAEIIAMRACGLGDRTLVRSVLLVSCLIAVLVAGLSLYVRPWAYERSYWLKANSEANFDFSRLRPGLFHEIGEKKYVVFLEALDEQAMHAQGVFIQQRTEGVRKITRADEGWQEIDPVTAEKNIVLSNGYNYEFTEGKGVSKLLRFHGTRLPLVTKLIDSIGYRRKAASTQSLAASSVNADRAELQWRLSTGFSTVLLGLLGIPLGLTATRQGKSAKVFIAVIIFAIYYNLTAVAKTWLEQDVVGSFPGVWWPQFLLAVLLVVLFRRSSTVCR
jgi:lipopolysaccharide export system permease protein